MLLCLALAATAAATVYNAQPKLVVIVIIDQFRADYLERSHDQFGPGGFRLLTDRGAYFTDCNFDYANTETAPGHATLLTGAYSNGHGIIGNNWWDPATRRMITPVDDTATRMLPDGGPGASPRLLLADTLGDEMKLASQGKSRVFAISLKARAAVLPGGFAADAAYWIEPAGGHWQSSTFYMSALPAWVQQYNAANPEQKYWNRDWKDAAGNLLRRTTKAEHAAFYDVVGATPFANDYELDFARELIAQQKLGQGPATDLLVVSLSANDILGHAVGPDSPQTEAMALALDRQLSDFFSFLGQQLGLANVWIALSADHGVSPVPAVANKFRIPGQVVNAGAIRKQVNAALTAKFSPGKPADYVRVLGGAHAFLNEDAFAALHVNEADAERAAGEALVQAGMRGYFTRAQLARGDVPPDALGRQYLHSYSPYPGWFVLAVPPPYTFPLWPGGATTHGSPYSYDTHVPLAFFGLAFQPGVYRGRCEPVDMVATLASLLGINAPNHAHGRVLTRALRQPGGSEQ